MRLHSYLQSAESILVEYNRTVPFATWLKEYFRKHKKFGSRDRKTISDLCFCFFRIGNLFADADMQTRLLIAQYLCHASSNYIIELKPEWAIDLPLHERLKTIGADDHLSIFPLHSELTIQIDQERFVVSHLEQPDLFLRVRPEKIETVSKKLKAVNLSFEVEGTCIRLPNTSKVDEVIQLDEDAVVQDFSSQQVLHPLIEHWQKEKFTSWDCCAASGGKTILLHDHFPKAQLTVSDIRESILHNLRNRFKRAGIFHYQSFVADVSSGQLPFNRMYDVIICDAPCSGSGTWGRTPEQLVYFTKEKINHYANLQKSIAINASKQLQKGGMLLYITCSVFKKENEEVVEAIRQSTELELIGLQYFEGYSKKADTLFAALFRL